MTDRKLMQQALTCLEGWENMLDEDCGDPQCDECKPFRNTRNTITTLRERLAQPETIMAEYKFQTYAAYKTDGEMKIGVVPEQEPVAWRNAALRVGEDLCSVGPFGYYDMTAQQWLDWALSVVTCHPAPRREWVGLTLEEIGLLTTGDGWSHLETPALALFARAIEAKLREKQREEKNA